MAEVVAKAPARKQSKRAAVAPQPEVRRVPTQERSKLRLSRILDAANQLFSDVGFDAATMEGIADRAGTSIGSVYQFFPNKAAIFEALCARFFARAEELFGQVVMIDPTALARRDGAEIPPWEPLVERVIDAFWRFHLDEPGIRAVWANQNISAELIKAGDVVNRGMAARTDEVMKLFAPHLTPKARAAAAEIVVETVSAIMFVAVRRDEREAQRLIGELKRMVALYLRGVFAQG